MKVGTQYLIVKKIKLHTKPLVEAEIIKRGIFSGETKKYYSFNGFRVKKENIVRIAVEV